MEKKEFYANLDRENKEYEAEKEIHNMDEKASITEHDHQFQMVSGNAVQCACGWGIFIDNQDEFKDGHIFRDGTLIV